MMEPKEPESKRPKRELKLPYQFLESHTDEVWFVQFSHNGKYLASASKDQSAIIWQVRDDCQVSMKHILKGHKKPVTSASWSPDDEELLTCGLEEALICWDVESGTCLETYEKTGVVSCGWLPDGLHIVYGKTNKSIYLKDLADNEIRSWEFGKDANVSEIAVTNDGKQILTLGTKFSPLMFDKDTNVQWKLFEERKQITSISLSEDNNFLLVNVLDHEIHLWNIEKGKHPSMVNTFKGHKCAKSIIRSCFGGVEHKVLASGSEDYKVYLWHRFDRTRIRSLPGHSGVVKCVSWNAKEPFMFASASDDRTIGIWGLPR